MCLGADDDARNYGGELNTASIPATLANEAGRDITKRNR